MRLIMSVTEGGVVGSRGVLWNLGGDVTRGAILEYGRAPGWILAFAGMTVAQPPAGGCVYFFSQVSFSTTCGLTKPMGSSPFSTLITSSRGRLMMSKPAVSE